MSFPGDSREVLEIEGPSALGGTVTVAGAKNAALPELAAALLIPGEVELMGTALLTDIEVACQLLEHLGCSVSRSPESIRCVTPVELSAEEAPWELVRRMRASVLVLGPLLARRGHARVALPGGCAIGARPIDQHLAGLVALGADIRLEHGFVEARAPRLQGNRFRFAVETVTGTENLILAAVLAQGTTVLERAAREPEVVDLVRLLRAAGAQIDGEGTDRIEIQGVASLRPVRHQVVPDRIEAGTMLIAGALTSGDVTVENVEPGDLEALLEALDESGVEVTMFGRSVRVVRRGGLRPRDLVTAPFPGFPTDLQAQWMVLMSQAEGTSTLVETIFEHRFGHVAELARLGASIELSGNRARILGPRRLQGAEVVASDLRASAALVLAGLVAEGRTMVEGLHHLDRGYANLEGKLSGLGASIRRVGTDRSCRNGEHHLSMEKRA